MHGSYFERSNGIPITFDVIFRVERNLVSIVYGNDVITSLHRRGYITQVQYDALEGETYTRGLPKSLTTPCVKQRYIPSYYLLNSR